MRKASCVLVTLLLTACAGHAAQPSSPKAAASETATPGLMALAATLRPASPTSAPPTATPSAAPTAAPTSAPPAAPPANPPPPPPPPAPPPQPGSGCTFYAPANGRPSPRGIVAIDPGHGGPDPGAIGTTQSGGAVSEAQLTLSLGLTLADALRQAGYAVVMTRTGDRASADFTSGDLSGGMETNQGELHDIGARVACANHAAADLLLAIHFNAFGDPSAGGTSVFYDPDRPFAARSVQLAQLIDTATVSALASVGYSATDRGVDTDTHLDLPAILPSSVDASYNHLLELGPTTTGWPEASAMPGALGEILFISNPQEATLASDPHVQAVMAQAYVAAIGQFLGR